MQSDNLERVYVDMGEGKVMGGVVLRRYTWGALVQCGFQCFKVSQNHLFKSLEAAKESARKGTGKKKKEASRGR